MRNWKLLIITMLALPLLVLAVRAEIPKTLSVQGVLNDAAGNPVDNGQYTATLSLYDSATGGSQLSEEELELYVVDGVFSAIVDLGNAQGIGFDNELWLEVVLSDGGVMSPRIRLTAVPYALRAAVADSVAGGGGGADNDWMISGDDIYREGGRVYVGSVPRGDQPPSRDGKMGGRDPATSKLRVTGFNEGISSFLTEQDADADARTAIFGRRYRLTPNEGSGFGVHQTNTAITGYNVWGDSYTFGVAGYTWFDSPHTAGVLGGLYTGDTWGALGYLDDLSTAWGIYTPNSAHIGGTAEVSGLRLTTGAAPGYILTGDVNGNASWQPPSAATSDDDWVIQGSNLTHDTQGVVALGTDTPVPFSTALPAATLQVAAPITPAVVIDKTSGTFTRWSVYQAGEIGRLLFGHSSAPGVPDAPTVMIGRSDLKIVDENVADSIVMQTFEDLAPGPVMFMYSPGETTPSLTIDGHTSDGAGAIHLRDGAGNVEVTVTGSHSGSGTGRVITPVLEITGGSDLSEQFDIEALGQTIEPGMVVSIDPERPGRLKLSGSAYDKRVAGVVSGAGGVNPGMLMGQRGSEADGELPVALVGRVYVHADATAGEIEPGDLLTTADRPGHAMRVVDSTRAAGAILGKAMTGLEEGQGLVLVLVSLQ